MEKAEQKSLPHLMQREAKTELMILFARTIPDSPADHALGDFVTLLETQRSYGIVKTQYNGNNSYDELLSHHRQQLREICKTITKKQLNTEYRRTLLRTRTQVQQLRQAARGEQINYFLKDTIGFLQTIRRDIALRD